MHYLNNKKKRLFAAFYCRHSAATSAAYGHGKPTFGYAKAVDLATAKK